MRLDRSAVSLRSRGVLANRFQPLIRACRLRLERFAEIFDMAKPAFDARKAGTHSNHMSIETENVALFHRMSYLFSGFAVAESDSRICASLSVKTCIVGSLPVRTKII